MNSFKKTLFVAINSILLFFVPSISASAQVPIESPVNVDLVELVNNLTGLVRPLVIVTLLGVIIFGGYTRLTAAGDPEKEKKSMQILTAGIIGFVIIVLAPIIVGFIGNLLGIDSIIDFTTP